MLRQRNTARAGAVRDTTARAAKGAFFRQHAVWRAAVDQRILRLRSRDQESKGTHVCRSAFRTPAGIGKAIIFDQTSDNVVFTVWGIPT